MDLHTSKWQHLQVIQTFQGCEAKPITPPQSTGNRGSYNCIVDCENKPFSITWSGSAQYPDFSNLHETINVVSVNQSPEIAAIWRDSTFIDYGAHASIRATEDSRFPILKLAHSDDLSRKLIQHEFNMLVELSELRLPIAECDEQPILDNGIICGYRMKKLYKLELSELCSRTDDVKRLLDKLHSAGYCHGDFHPSNIMMNEHGRLLFIDVSFSGRLGSTVPTFFPAWVYSDGVYNIGSDLDAFDKYCVTTDLQKSTQ